MTFPLPSTLVFLSDLPHLPSGSKVRFLGCVSRYSTQSGNLYLQHAYPKPVAGKQAEKEVTAVADLELLGDTVKTTDTQIGEWVNVIGTVGEKSKTMDTRIKAVMLWSASGIKLEEYEKAVEGRKASEAATRKV
ncbi:hypothetical protein MMC30_001768 [Trapelia coarctata]|nr:hypothetical protein [Trapelia coarctata]